MEETYELQFGGQAVGKVTVTREGLYYRFRCRCRMPGDVVSRVLVRCGEREESLGVLVPEGDGFGLNARLAAKKLGQGSMVFAVVPNRTPLAGKFVPIKPEEPFAYIARLKDAYLEERSGRIGVVIK